MLRPKCPPREALNLGVGTPPYPSDLISSPAPLLTPAPAPWPPSSPGCTNRAPILGLHLCS